jgi:hypothetical protein
VWPALEPTPGFAGRVLDALHGTASAPVARRPRAALWLGAGAAAVALAGVALALVGRRGEPEAAGDGGRLVAAARQRVHIGRAVAVAERGAELSWSSEHDDAVVEQARGSVFYRIDHGGPFMVSTPAAQVHVTGTCFRVALAPADGALDVTVFEGSVLVRNERGEMALAAGEEAHVAPGAAPAWGGAIAREATGRAAEARVRELEHALELARRQLAAEEPRGEAGGGKAFGFTPEDRKRLARRCELRYGLPDHLRELDLPKLDGFRDLSTEERTAVTRVMEEQRNQYVEELRALYLEVVGDSASAATLSPMGLRYEIIAKSRSTDYVDGVRRILQEWAGGPSPADPASAPAVERLLRLQIAVGDEFARRLGESVGPERARKMAAAMIRFRVNDPNPAYCAAR